MSNNKTKSGKWWGFLAIWFCVLLVAGAAACFILYKYAAVYEVTRPELAMDELLENTDGESLMKAALEQPAGVLSEFDDEQAIFTSYYENTLRDYELTYRKSISADADHAAFVVRAGNVNLYNVTLAAKDDADLGFGRHEWELESISLADYSTGLGSVKAELYAPEGATLQINAIPVGEQYLTGDAVPPTITELESRFPNPPTLKKYVVEALYGDVLITAPDGTELAPTYDEASGVLSCVYAPETYSVTIEAPEDMVVSICGADLDPAEAVNADLGIFKDFQDYTKGAEWKTLRYTYEGLIGEPEITGRTADGTEVTPLISDSGKYLLYHPNDAALQAEVEETVETYFNAYMDYSSSSLSHEKLYRLLDCTLVGTRLNKYFRYSTEGMFWASDTDVSYDELTFSDFTPVGEDCFFCTIQYKGNFQAQSWYENYSYAMKNGYEMLFVRSGRRWLVAEMSAFS